MHESPLYAAIDLHSNNSFLTILDGSDRVVYERHPKNRLPEIVAALEPHRERILAVAVESTFNWYWLVDGLEEAGHAEEVVEPVGHAQCVFTIPKILRGYFLRNRELLGSLSPRGRRCAR